MFRGWGFLLGEIWILIALAALLGLFVGWLVWGRRPEAAAVDADEIARLRAELDACEARARGQAAKLAAEAVAPASEAPASEDVGTRPEMLSAPRGGQADDLKLIKGVGPKLEALLNRLGFWHFEQIAAWTDAEIAWVDANLETFKGRVTRDDWVAQARALAQAKTQG